jgi:hypothetical protein
MVSEEELEQDPDVPRKFKLAWVDDTVGRQGSVLFDGKVYWLVRIDKETGKCLNISLTPEEWKGRTKEMQERIKARK